MKHTLSSLSLSFSILSMLFQSAPAQWFSQNSGVKDNLTDVTMIDTATAVVVGYNGTILKTTDAGKHWIFKNSKTHNNLNAVSFSSTLEGYVVGTGVICHTTDGGETWDTSSVAENYVSVAAGGYPLFPAVYMGSDRGKIRFTYDEGKTWNDTTIDSNPIISIANRYALNSTVTLVATWYAVYQTFNGLQWSWTKNIFLPIDDLYSGDLKGSTLYLVGEMPNPGTNPLVLKRSLSDTTWQRGGVPSSFPGTLTDVQTFTDTSIVYISENYGKFFRSTDNGLTWLKETVPSNQWLNSLSFLTHDRGFLVGDSGVVFYTTNGGTTSVQSRELGSIPTGLLLSPNYPNPFNPTTNIHFSVARLTMVALKIYNSTGQEVESLLSAWREPGSYSITWTAKGLASGVYYCKLTAGDFSAVQKMILTK